MDDDNKTTNKQYGDENETSRLCSAEEKQTNPVEEAVISPSFLGPTSEGISFHTTFYHFPSHLTIVVTRVLFLE